MKTKRTFLSILTLCIALLFTACSGKGTAGTEKSQNTKTESGSESADDSNSKLNDLYQQENQIFADHEDVWNKAFGMMSKSAADPNGNYADSLADTVESNKESFTDDELKTLTADIEAIRKIEEQIAEIEKKLQRLMNEKRKIQDLITLIRKTVPKTHLLSRISLVRIMMGILLMKACFPKMQ